MAKKWLTIREASEALGVSESTVRKRARSSIIPRKLKSNNQGFLYQVEVSGDSQEEEKVSVEAQSFFSDDTLDYFYDSKREVYIFHSIPGQKGSVCVEKSKIDALIWDYSNETGGLSVNEICRKYGLARPTLIRILKVLGKTHDSAPFSDEEMTAANEEVLIESLVRAKEQRVLVKAERIRYRQLVKQAEQFDQFERIIFPRLEDRLKDRPSIHNIKVDLSNVEKNDHLVIVGLTDLHVGKKGLFGWNLERAREAAVNTCLAAMGQSVNKWGAPSMWILPCGSDMIHIDNYQNTTTQGTPQDVDGDPIEMLSTAFMALEQIIEGLRKVAPVKVVAIPGNHDRVLGLSVGLMLKARYHDINTVEIDIAKEGFSYTRYGNSLLGFHHGDGTKASDLPSVMAIDRAEDWGECKGGWEWFTGHWHGHKVRADEFNGCRVWTMPSLSGTDRWHRLKGYVGNRRQVALYRVDKENGVGGVEFIMIE